MSHQIDDVMALCCKISESRQIKAAVQNSAKGAAVAGGGAFVGGLLGGPPGLFIGSALGGAVGWWMTSDKFHPLHQIIMEMPRQQKTKLYSEVMAVLGKLDWVDLAQLIFLVMGNSSLQMRVLTTLISFATKELGAKVEYAQK
ncbi:protein C19orf12 homolog [Sinocyclocheilus rhinocerous]|uniref:protein C19orf12 homolog n=1 Tax=Sinocyclocheilus rhinocerous TaxID=307959 RepID=UPI0007B955CE|nr:PREDICTED: protein C19orf12 homolog [Sinocyclocheilus rhinocerous]XP_016403580.1 PREDICTED: protein C19orf12 homolog [Sinocyclocheilus rhinocerous]